MFVVLHSNKAGQYIEIGAQIEFRVGQTLHDKGLGWLTSIFGNLHNFSIFQNVFTRTVMVFNLELK